MNLQEKIESALAAMKAITGIESVMLTIKHDDVEEMKRYAEDNNTELYLPSGSTNYYRLLVSDADNIGLIVRVRSPKYEINTTFKLIEND